jgi:hypothetical protein
MAAAKELHPRLDGYCILEKTNEKSSTAVSQNAVSFQLDRSNVPKGNSIVQYIWFFSPNKPFFIQKLKINNTKQLVRISYPNYYIKDIAII